MTKTVQHDHYSYQNQMVDFPIFIVLDQLRTPENVGMCLRLAEAFGAEGVALWSDGPQLDQRSLKKTARSVEKNLRLIYYNDLISLIENKRQENYQILSLELTNKSQSLSKYQFQKEQKICLIVGAERQGIRPEVLEKSDACIQIDLFGQNSSINVANSLGIALYEITKQQKA